MWELSLDHFTFTCSVRSRWRFILRDCRSGLHVLPHFSIARLNAQPSHRYHKIRAGTLGGQSDLTGVNLVIVGSGCCWISVFFSLLVHSGAKWPGCPQLKHVPWGALIGCNGADNCFAEGALVRGAVGFKFWCGGSREHVLPCVRCRVDQFFTCVRMRFRPHSISWW